MYFAQAKYFDAYEIINSEKFKYKKEEGEEFRYLYAFICTQLYIESPSLNSEYRNKGIINAAYLLVSDDESMKSSGAEFIRYLTETLFNDIVPILNGPPGADSIMFSSLSTETLRSLTYYTVDKTRDTPTLQYIGARFYNDAAYIQTTENSNDSYDIANDKLVRMMYLLEIAELFYEVLCDEREIDCESLTFINSMTRKPRP